MTNLNFTDQSKVKEGRNPSTIGEYTRLVNEIKAKPAKFFINSLGERVDIPAKLGIDIETCTFTDIINWLADTRIKKSQTNIAFAHRIMSVRFPTEYAQHRDKINNRYKLEYEMIQSNSKNDPSWIGEVGFANKVRLDNSLTNPLTITEKLKNDVVRVRKKT